RCDTRYRRPVSDRTGSSPRAEGRSRGAVGRGRSRFRPRSARTPEPPLRSSLVGPSSYPDLSVGLRRSGQSRLRRRGIEPTGTARLEETPALPPPARYLSRLYLSVEYPLVGSPSGCVTPDRCRGIPRLGKHSRIRTWSRYRPARIRIDRRTTRTGGAGARAADPRRGSAFDGSAPPRTRSRGRFDVSSPGRARFGPGAAEESLRPSR